ncbi:ETC complex I subunit conserved region-domain-containing protein [Aspergillus pseudodeflectus]|uniref:NADH dehydrogenase [ubiquinone] iron-sulfur protein 4, mitochondrial n=1 Tax=Aspergillus pseudodeflectus TaxID=176178 RepID=A0ABR4K354_9EURO
MSLIRAGSLAYSRVGRVIVTKNTRFLSTTALRASQSEQSPIKVNPSEAPTTPHGESSLIQKETPSEAMARHQPDYDATIDHGTSKFSPVPKRVMDGSEPGETVPAAVLSGAPTDLQARTVRIYRPSKPATQSGDWHSHHWRMDWDILQKGHRWENPLMGWQSSADCMQGTHLNFKSKEDAILFAQKQGYEYFVQEPNERKFVPKAYANNFMHEPKKLKHIRTK